MLIKDIVLESDSSTRWVIVINNQPSAYYASKQQAIKMKQELTLSLGTELKKYNIEIVEMPKEKLKLESIQEALVSSNRDDTGRWTTKWILSVSDGTKWKPVSLFRTEEQAREYDREFIQKFGGKYKVEEVDYPKTQFT